VTTGDNLAVNLTDIFYNDPTVRTFDLKDLRGKTLRIGLDGEIPADNPFVGVEGAYGQIYTRGHRNAYTLAVDPLTGDMYTGEIGYDLDTSHEEINKLQSGGNYAWPRCQGASTGTFGGPCPVEGAIDPFLTYQHFAGGAVVAGPVWRRGASPGDLPAELGDGMFYGDFSRVWLRFAKFSDDGSHVVDSIQLAKDLPARPLAMTQGPDGDVYMLLYGGWFTPTPADSLVRVHIEASQPADVGQAAQGSLSVPAWLESGVTLTNSKDCALPVHLTAQGTWTYAPGTDHGAAGVVGQTTTEQFYMAGVAPGVLLMRQGETFTAIGDGADVVLQPHATASLLINDWRRADLGQSYYDDNSGELQVAWSTGDCL
jgi:hypothetical protein